MASSLRLGSGAGLLKSSFDKEIGSVEFSWPLDGPAWRPALENTRFARKYPLEGPMYLGSPPESDTKPISWAGFCWV